MILLQFFLLLFEAKQRIKARLSMWALPERSVSISLSFASYQSLPEVSLTINDIRNKEPAISGLACHEWSLWLIGWSWNAAMGYRVCKNHYPAEKRDCKSVYYTKTVQNKRQSLFSHWQMLPSLPAARKKRSAKRPQAKQNHLKFHIIRQELSTAGNPSMLIHPYGQAAVKNWPDGSRDQTGFATSSIFPIFEFKEVKLSG